MSVIAFDTETFLIEPGKLAPEIVCLQYQHKGGDPMLAHGMHSKGCVYSFLESNYILVGHNVAFDMAVIAAQWPELLPAIIAKYDRDQVTDTLLREQLIMISRGQFRSYADSDGELHGVKYSLADCIERHFGRQLKKEGWRLFYRAFDGHPDVSTWDKVAADFQQSLRDAHEPEWVTEYFHAGTLTQKDIDGLLAARPEEAREYALKDATTTLELYEDQSRVCDPSVLVDQYRQARAAFALHLSSCWGIYTDADAVDALEGRLTADFDSLREELQAVGIIREDGTADTKAAKAAMVAACEEDDIPIAKTKGGDVSLSAEACGRFDDDSIIGMYSDYLTLRKTLANDVAMLRKGCEVPIQPRYDMADTGRTRCSKPNIQAINRGAGIREAFRPRPGNCFIQADFEGLELHTLAQWCLKEIGYSKLAEALNAGKDVHLLTAANTLGMTYEEAAEGLKAKSKTIKEYRQRAKAVNFGLPGGLGAAKLSRYARVAYKVNMSEQEALAAKQAWLALYPEMNEHFKLASIACNNFDKRGTETHIFSGRVRGGARYSALCNGRFQGLGADAAKNALWLVTKACYVDVNSPLYGWRVVAFVHDEIIAEGPIGDCDAAAREMSRLMCLGANVFVPACPVEAPPVAMMLWSKSAVAVTDDQGRLVPWAPEEKVAA